MSMLFAWKWYHQREYKMRINVLCVIINFLLGCNVYCHILYLGYSHKKKPSVGWVHIFHIDEWLLLADCKRIHTKIAFCFIYSYFLLHSTLFFTSTVSVWIWITLPPPYIVLKPLGALNLNRLFNRFEYKCALYILFDINVYNIL